MTQACLTRSGKLHLSEILDLLGSETRNWSLGLFCRWRSVGLKACMGPPVIWANVSPSDQAPEKARTPGRSQIPIFWLLRSCAGLPSDLYPLTLLPYRQERPRGHCTHIPLLPRPSSHAAHRCGCVHLGITISWDGGPATIGASLPSPSHVGRLEQ